MEFVEQLKEYLLGRDNALSKVTLKNYLSDVTKFLRWYEAHYKTPFNLSLHHEYLLNDYKTFLISSNVSHTSQKRYISSLRTFFDFLETTYNYTNPFNSSKPKESDHWYLQEFKNYLYVYGAASLTIKNYVIDIQNFKSWLTKECALSNTQVPTPFTYLNSGTIREYKAFLEHKQQLSKQSVNRKLSSLRKYIDFAEKQGYIAFATPSSTHQLQLINTSKGNQADSYLRYSKNLSARYFYALIILVFTIGIGLSVYKALFTTASSQNPSYAEILSPRVLSFEGRFMDMDENLITRPTDVRFSIYDSPTASGSSLLWQEVQYALTPNENGVFTVLLGTHTRIPESIFKEDRQLYLGITIANTKELTPRHYISITTKK